MSNLRFLNETTVGSSVSTVDVKDVFNSNFDVYKIVVPQMTTAGTASTDVAIRFINSSGTVITSSQYDYANLAVRHYTSFGEEKATNGTYIQKLGQADQEPGTSCSYTRVSLVLSCGEFTIFHCNIHGLVFLNSSLL